MKYPSWTSLKLLIILAQNKSIRMPADEKCSRIVAFTYLRQKLDISGVEPSDVRVPAVAAGQQRPGLPRNRCFRLPCRCGPRRSHLATLLSRPAIRIAESKRPRYRSTRYMPGSMLFYLCCPADLISVSKASHFIPFVPFSRSLGSLHRVKSQLKLSTFVRFRSTPTGTLLDNRDKEALNQGLLKP